MEKKTFVLCMCATQQEHINNEPSEVYELDSLDDCIEECEKLCQSNHYYGAYVVDEGGQNPWCKIF